MFFISFGIVPEKRLLARKLRGAQVQTGFTVSGTVNHAQVIQEFQFPQFRRKCSLELISSQGPASEQESTNRQQADFTHRERKLVNLPISETRDPLMLLPVRLLWDMGQMRDDLKNIWSIPTNRSSP
jgi:hypothetical protein